MDIRRYTESRLKKAIRDAAEEEERTNYLENQDERRLAARYRSVGD